MNRGASIIVGSISFSLAILFFWYSGINSDIIFQPISTISGTTTTGNLNLISVFLVLVMFSIGYASIVSSVIEDGKNNTLLISSIAPLLIVLGLYKNSIFGFFFIAGFVLSIFLLMRRAESEKELYKKISVYNIAYNSTKSAFFLISLFIAISVLVSMALYPQHTEKVLRDSFSIFSVFSQGMNNQFAETQLQLMYDVLDSVEVSLLTASSIYMSPQCSKEFNNALDNIDKYARDKIRTSMESSAQQTQANMEDRIMNIIKSSDIYNKIHILMMFTLPLGALAMIEIFKSIIVAPLAGILARLFTRTIKEQDSSVRY